MAPPPSPELFFPYLYVPSADSDFVEVVSPWGSLKLPIPLMQFYGVAIAIAAVLLSILISCFGRSRAAGDNETPESVIEQTYTKKKPKKSAKKAADETEKKAKSALEENILRNGTNSYYYAHKVREVSAESTRVRQVISTYGWSDAKKTVH
ncbi:hypothetical protein DYB32_006968 [Aphanomyces invadans]|uniref:Uncharacterized protein n=1 Tax=Aphanomyces invadans TaxID=157072 RepID=A0A418AQ51_9STRA|nr:hypothetical protein DYB32_006968 [Aphanomyces invadans]